MHALRENPLVPAVLLLMSTAILIMWQPSLALAIIVGAALVWLAVSIWRGPRNWAALWKPVWGWGTTAFYILGGIFCLAFETPRTGFWWMGVFFLIAGVGNAIGLFGGQVGCDTSRRDNKALATAGAVATRPRLRRRSRPRRLAARNHVCRVRSGCIRDTPTPPSVSGYHGRVDNSFAPGGSSVLIRIADR